jgi:hypothetical protein
MHGHFNIWKATIGVIVYVALCLAVLCFSPPDDEASLTLPTGSGDAAPGQLGS